MWTVLELMTWPTPVLEVSTSGAAVVTSTCWVTAPTVSCRSFGHRSGDIEPEILYDARLEPRSSDGDLIAARLQQGTAYSPALLVWAFHSTPVAWLVTTTLALGTVAPDISVTVPFKLAVDCARRLKLQQQSSSKSIATRTINEPSPKPASSVPFITPPMKTACPDWFEKSCRFGGSHELNFSRAGTSSDFRKRSTGPRLRSPTPYRGDFGKAGTHCFLDMQLHSRMNMQFAGGQISEQIGFSALISMHGSDIAKLHTILRNTFLFL